MLNATVAAIKTTNKVVNNTDYPLSASLKSFLPNYAVMIILDEYQVDSV